MSNSTQIQLSVTIFILLIAFFWIGRLTAPDRGPFATTSQEWSDDHRMYVYADSFRITDNYSSGYEVTAGDPVQVIIDPVTGTKDICRAPAR